MKTLKRILLALLIAVLVPSLGFRLAAHLREVDTSADIRPETGRMVATTMGAIFVQEAGPTDGPPLLLAHGTAAWSGLWGDTMTALADQDPPHMLTETGHIPQVEAPQAFQALLLSVLSDMTGTN